MPDPETASGEFESDPVPLPVMPRVIVGGESPAPQSPAVNRPWPFPSFLIGVYR